MKILSVIWKISEDRLKGFANDTNGFVIVRDLCEYLGKKEESYLLLGKEYLPNMDLGNIHIVDSKNVFEKAYDLKSHNEIMVEAFKKALIDIQPDIVNFHDGGDFCRECIKICIKKQIPYVFTAHGIIEKNQMISTKYNERNILWQEELFAIPGLNIVAVGKGTANKIIKEYPNLALEQVRVIQNGTPFKANIICNDLKLKLGFQNKKILICPGKITNRKNQLQIVRAFKLLPKSVSEKIGVVFCGNDRLNGELQIAIEEAGLELSLKYVGVLNREQMQEHYSICDGMIMPSITEGLSVAAIEAIAYGMPLIMFSDLECAVDLDDEKVCCFAKNRTDQALAEAIERWERTIWDKNAILKYAEHFSMERVAEEYIDYYRDILDKYNTGCQTS